MIHFDFLPQGGHFVARSETDLTGDYVPSEENEALKARLKEFLETAGAEITADGRLVFSSAGYGLRTKRKGGQRTQEILAENEALKNAIRKHRDYKGDDRCYLDDYKLYEVLGEPIPQSACQLDVPKIMLENCERFVVSRHDPDKPYLSPQREVEQARAKAFEECKAIVYRFWDEASEIWDKGTIEYNDSMVTLSDHAKGFWEGKTQQCTEIEGAIDAASKE